MNKQPFSRSALLAGYFIVTLSGCDNSTGSGTERRPPPPPFHYSLRLQSTDDLTRAFAAGRPIDTLGLVLKELHPADGTEVPTGRREYVELLKRSRGNRVVRLLLSRGTFEDDDPMRYGELFLVMMDAKGGLIDGVFLHRFECSEHIKSTLSMGWHEQMIVWRTRTDTKEDGDDFATITYQYSTQSARLDADSIRTAREWMATSDIVQGGSALLPMCGRD